MIANHTAIAETIIQRLKGLLGTSHLLANQGLWIKKCNSIHTFFMRYPIDCIFLDSQLRVQKVVVNVTPWKIVWPVRKANSVIELPAHTVSLTKTEIGDQLHVGN